MEEYSEKQSCLEIFKRDRAIYEATPPRSFFSRSKLRRKLRYSYGDAVGAGNNVSMPLTAWEARKGGWAATVRKGWGRSFNRGWLYWLTCWTAFFAAVAVALFLILVVGIFESHPKPLPPGIVQKGYTFVIPPNYATRANYKDIHADDLCERLPQFDNVSSSGDEAEAHSARDGSIVIECKLDD